MSVEMVDMTYEGDPDEVSISQARAKLPNLVHGAREGDVTYITVNGARYAALVPADVAERHEAAEEEYWARRVAEAEQSDTVSWDEAIIALEGRS
ncbi:type II toxin-antitoxin system prevent-host-death family antitoxin [Saccharopolyspora sp. HNM0986]|uniref:type II toxin-antitoxin system prevent-host-death family antitoxin n=1 Tax=Saccharopolyspora galaxeae TaxID=2781241 RepID=UPI00190C1845|nr:type II toxin-antitoxin system prevent-host-death family antitoxin [Saccharopolyspora sp. HNM0986]MBK0868642.1 type II toxin-antitoxin system prevent-host-death family antitoxin [Saccharopolyspora sp. HNM0986]